MKMNKTKHPGFSFPLKKKMRLRRLPLLAAAVAALLSFTPHHTQAQTTAAPVNDFLNSTGINTHIDQGASEANYEGPLKYMGIRNVRDGHRNSGNYITLHNNTVVSGSYPGVKVIIHSSWPSVIVGEATPMANAGALTAIEGLNEPNNFPVVYAGGTTGGSYSWQGIRQFQADLYSTVKGNATLQNYPMINLSNAGGETDNAHCQWLTYSGTTIADYACCHNYVDTGGTFYNNAAWSAADPTANFANGLYQNYSSTWGGGHHYPGYSGTTTPTLADLPRATTETSWGTGGGTAHPVSQDQQGKLMLNTYLAQYKRGWKWTCWYEMFDNEGGGSQYQGIYTSSHTPKTGATYMHNFTTILADITSGTAGSLNYSIPSEPTTVHDLLLQKSNGTFYLCVWDERIAGSGTDNVTVSLGGTCAVTQYDPIVGTTGTSLGNTASIPLSLTDHPIILAITVTTGPLPSPWTHAAVGTTGGNSTYGGGTYYVTCPGSGAVAYYNDSFQYAYQAASGDCSITARVASQPSSGSQAGVMIRSDLGTGALDMLMDVTSGGSLSSIYRTTTSGQATTVSGGSGSVPYWVRVTRVGNVFTSYKSSDGVTWTQVSSVTISMGTNTDIGLFEASSSSGTATFDNVTVTP